MIIPNQGKAMVHLKSMPERIICDKNLFKQYLFSKDGFDLLNSTHQDGWNIRMVDKTQRLITYWDKDQLLFANVSRVGHYKSINNEICVVVNVEVTAKFNTTLTNMAKQAYLKLAEEIGATHIVGDCSQSQDTENMWKKWISNPQKYGWEDGFLWDSNTEKSIKSDNYNKYLDDGSIYKRFLPMVKINPTAL